MNNSPQPDLDILVVDDDQPIRNLVRQIVRRIGYPSREAVDGEDAISKLGEKIPDLLILDLMMPRVSGWDVLEWLDENGSLGSLPVVVLTAVGAEKVDALSRYDINAIIAKPFEIASLMQTLRDILDA